MPSVGACHDTLLKTYHVYACLSSLKRLTLTPRDLAENGPVSCTCLYSRYLCTLDFI